MRDRQRGGRRGRGGRGHRSICSSHRKLNGVAPLPTCRKAAPRCVSSHPIHPLTSTHIHNPPPQKDVLLYYGATAAGSGPPALGCKSPRASFDPQADGFARERGSYQRAFEHP